MSRSRAVLRYGYRVLIFTALGCVAGAIVGVLIVVVGWFPAAMANYAEHPNYVDPRSILFVWSLTWGAACGVIGSVVGLVAGAVLGLSQSSASEEPA